MIDLGNNSKINRVGRCLLVAFFIFLFVSFPLLGANLLTNPNFETGDTTGWTLDDFVSAYLSDYYVTKSGPYQGVYALSVSIAGFVDPYINNQSLGKINSVTRPFTPHGPGKIVINEVINNSVGDEEAGDCIELVNVGSETVNLAGYSITDGDATDTISAWNLPICATGVVTGTTLIGPGQYAVILSNKYSTLYSTYALYNFPPGSLILGVGDGIITNGLTTTDPLTLYRPGGQTQAYAVSWYGNPKKDDNPLNCDAVDTYDVPAPGEAWSAERIDPFDDTDLGPPSNWTSHLELAYASYGRAYQLVSVKPNTTYRVAGWVYDTGSKYATLALFWYSDPGGWYTSIISTSVIVPPTRGAGWEFISATVTSPSNARSAEFSLLVLMENDYTGGGSCKFDKLHFGELDVTPPGKINDLQAVSVSNRYVKLSWTAPGDDGISGDFDDVVSSPRYDIRYATFPITDSNWSEARSTYSLVSPTLAGKSETTTLTTLTNGVTYYLAIKTIDDESNQSSVSNCISFCPQLLRPAIKPVAWADQYPTISWEEVPNVHHYEVWRGTDPAALSLVETINFSTTTVFVDTNTVSGTRYYYRIKAVNVGPTETTESILEIAEYDPQPPIVSDSSVVAPKTVNSYNEIKINLNLSDDRQIVYVKGYWRKKGETTWQEMSISPEIVQPNYPKNYTGVATISRSSLAGGVGGVIEYYFEVSDGSSVSYLPAAAPSGIYYNIGISSRTKKILTPNVPISFGENVCQVKIYTSSGRMVKQIYRGSSSYIVWDGKDDSEKVLESGAYVFRADKDDGSYETGTLIIAK